MGKRLTPEEREARIREYEEAKAARQAARLEKRKARAEAYEKAKIARERQKRGVKPAEILDSTRAGQVKKFPTYKGNLEVGDEVGFRWIGLAMAGKVLKIEKEQNYRIRDEEDNFEEVEEKVGGLQTYCMVKENSEGIVYPIKRNDILAKKVNDKWIDSCK